MRAMFKNAFEALRNYPKWYREKTMFTVPYRIRAGQATRAFVEQRIDSKSKLAYMRRRSIRNSCCSLSVTEVWLTVLTFWALDCVNNRGTSCEYFFSDLRTYEAEYLLSPELQRKYGRISTSMHVDQMIRTQDNDVVK